MLAPWFLAALTMGLAGSCHSPCCEPRPASCEPGPPASEDATIDYVEVGVEFCRWLDRCQPQDLVVYHGGDVEACVAYERCTESAPISWRVTEECIQAIRDEPCDGDVIGLMHQSSICEQGGPLPFAQEGEACDYWVCRGDEPGLSTRVYCDEGLHCGDDFACEPLPQDGDACSVNNGPGTLNDPCVPYLHCDLSEGRCRPDLAPGSPCTIQTTSSGKEIDPCSWEGPCIDGVCQDWTPGEAVPGLGEGNQCEPGYGACQKGLACPSHVCQEIVCNGADGAPCSPGSCAGTRVCNERTERCEQRGPDCGDEEENCSPGEFCNLGTFTCQPLP